MIDLLIDRLSQLAYYCVDQLLRVFQLPRNKHFHFSYTDFREKNILHKSIRGLYNENDEEIEGRGEPKKEKTQKLRQQRIKSEEICKKCSVSQKSQQTVRRHRFYCGCSQARICRALYLDIKDRSFQSRPNLITLWLLPNNSSVAICWHVPPTFHILFSGLSISPQSYTLELPLFLTTVPTV